MSVRLCLTDDFEWDMSVKSSVRCVKNEKEGITPTEYDEKDLYKWIDLNE